MLLPRHTFERATQERERQELEKLLARPELARLYELHMHCRWRASLASVIDVYVAGGISLALWGLAVTYTPLLTWLHGLSLVMDGQDAFEASIVPFIVAGVVLYLAVVPRLFGTTLGLQATRLVALDPATGRPLDPSKVRSPHKSDYYRNRLPGILYVPEDRLPPREDPCLPKRPHSH